jgi:hypothetical protein
MRNSISRREENIRISLVTAWVLSQARSRGICGGQSGIVEEYIPVFRFLLPILIHRITAYLLIILSLTPGIPRFVSESVVNSWTYEA